MSDIDGASAGADLGALARPESRVLLVGTGSHPPGSPLPCVPAVERSLRALAAALREQGGVPDENLRVLVDPSSPLEFGEAVGQAAAEASDALLVHVVGHGLVGSDNGLYLATCATDDLVDGLSYKALAYQALRQAVQRSSARAVAVILDCCFSGRAEAPLGPPALDAVFEQTLVRGGFLLASTAREEHGLARSGATYTAFTGALIRLLRDGDPTGPEQLTLDHAYRYLNRVLPEEDAPRPRRHSSDQAGELVLASNSAYRPRRPAPPAEEPLASGAEAVEAPCPFRGLRPFRAEDARYFFGQDEAVADVTRLVRSGGLIAVVGASGSGKTSLLRAGVIPALEARSEGWTVVTIKPGTDTPTTALAQRSAALTGHDRAVLLVDQFEELFTADATEDERERFVTGLAALTGGPITVVIAVRADFYEACTRYPVLVRALEGRQVVVSPLRPGQLREVIERPAKAAGLFLEEGLSDTLLHDARVHHAGEHTAVLPLLSHALLATWQQKSGALLTLSGYRATGGIDEAISRTAEEAYKALVPGDRPHVRGLLLRLVRLGEGVEDTRRRLLLGDLAAVGHLDTARRVLQALAEARLVTVDADGAEIAHEALLYAWPRLRAWIEEDRAALLTLQQISDAARVWDEAGRQETDLYRGPRLDTAAHAVSEQQANDGTDGVFGPVTHDFLDRSLEYRDRQRHAARRARRTRRTVTATVCVLALVASAVSFISVHEHRQAAHQAALIRSTDLAADASALSATDPGLAAQLAVGAYRSAPTQDATTQLYTALAAPLDSVVGDTGRQVLRIATQRDGNLAAASSTDGSVRIWDLATPSAPVLQATLHTAGAAAIALAPRGRLLTAVCPTARDLCLWNLADPRKPSVVGRLPRPADNPHGRLKIMSMDINPDGTLLAAASSYGTTLVWSIAEPAHPRLVAELPTPTSRKSDTLAAVAFSPRSDLLATTILGGKTRLWNLSRPSAPASTATIAKGYAAVAFSPEGTMLSAVGDSDFGLWRTDIPSKPRSVKIDNYAFASSDLSNLMAVAFSPDGARLAVSGLDSYHNNGQLCLLSLSPARLTNSASPTCTPTGFGTLALAYLRGGALLSGGPDGVVRSWRTALPRVEDVDAPYLPSGWDFSRSGHLMAGPVSTSSSSSPASFIGIWETSAPHRVATIKLSDTVQQANLIGPDNMLLSVAHDGRVQLWDLHDPHHPVRGASLGTASFPTRGNFIINTGVFADRAGDLVTVPGSDGRVHLWRITDARHAAKAGSFRLPASDDWSGILDDGRTAFVATPKGIEWWDTSDPRHPVRGDTTQLADANQEGLIAQGNIIAVSIQRQSAPTGGNTIRLFQVTAGKVRVSTSLQGVIGTEVEISDDSRLLAATGNGDGTVRLWDISDPRHPRNGATVRTLEKTQGITFDPRNHLMADWNSDDGIQLWDIHDSARPVLKATIPSPDYGSMKLDFLPSGSTLAVARRHGVTFYSTDLAGLADRVCSYTGKSMPKGQWHKYAPGIPYRDPCPSYER
ncbi:caspase family protein [Streptomyces sp. NBC_01221]|uniref:caspase, EACC1-associated type n=1 Tax=Streptomyces sp. NBC_01221 TaxID=2903782 RepID=UPI002255E07D|nr:caspase family protein [Streptomyces sp. NBC_01221]MCX4791605.1 caspase family protein [Streptomyces sp. NBC_01221]